jgi:glyoxylate/hydroxypyruvate/2-ketogluconate reductase
MSGQKMDRPRVLIARQMFPEVAQRLRQHFDVSTNDEARDWPRDELISRLQGHDGVVVAATEPIDATLVAACPQLKAVCSMAVGYNNIDVAACTARGITVTNAPDVGR